MSAAPKATPILANTNWHAEALLRDQEVDAAIMLMQREIDALRATVKTLEHRLMGLRPTEQSAPVALAVLPTWAIQLQRDVQDLAGEVARLSLADAKERAA